MARIKKIKQTESDIKVSDILKNINEGLTDPKFISLASVSAVLQSKTDAYEAARSLANNGSRAARVVKNVAKADAITCANEVGDDVNALAKGDLETILKCRYPFWDGIRRPVVMEDAKSFTVTNTGTLGQVMFIALKGPGAVSIKIKWGLGNTFESVTEWHECEQSASKCIVSNLPSQSRIWGRLTSVGRRGQILYSLPISTVVL